MSDRRQLLAGGVSVGLLAGRFAAAEALCRAIEPPPPTTALGALIAHVTGGHVEGGSGSFQPMNINYGLLPPMEAPKRDADGKKLPPPERGRAKKKLMSERALRDLDGWLGVSVAPPEAASA